MMHVTLTDINKIKGQPRITLSIDEVLEEVQSVVVTFVEQNTGDVRSRIAKKVNSDTFTVDIDPFELAELDLTMTDLNWNIFAGIQTISSRYFLHVESEYFGNKHLLSLEDWYQISSDDNNFADIHIRMHESATEQNASHVSLTDQQLTVGIHKEINNLPLTNQNLYLHTESGQNVPLVKNEKAGSLGFDEFTIELNQIDFKDKYQLLIEFDWDDQHLEQKVVSPYLRKITTMSAQTAAGNVVISEVGNGGISLFTQPIPSLSSRIWNKVKNVGSVGSAFNTVYMKIKRRYLKRLFKMGYTPYEQTTIVFESFGGRQISDSSLAIYEEFLRLYPNLNLIWAIDRSLVKYCKQNNIPYVVRETTKWVRTLEKSQFWISNARFPGWVVKPKRITFIQTWHGTPLKKLGLDIDNVEMPGTTTESYHKNFVKEANRWDALVSPNDYSSKIFRNAFGFNNQILKVGYPRNDKLINSSQADIEQLKESMGIPADKKVVLYAPTYRDNQFFEKGKYSFELPFSLAEFKERYGKDTVLILRMHYLISNALDITGFEDVVMDMSSYSNISDLYLVSDMLITDYSSVFFDYAYLQRPILFYPYDYHLYKDELRGFYLDYERDLPGQIVFEEHALMDQIGETIQHTDMSDNDQFQAFYDRFCSINSGTSSEKIVGYVMSKIQ